jgi:hypothetical protein
VSIKARLEKLEKSRQGPSSETCLCTTRENGAGVMLKPCPANANRTVIRILTAEEWTARYSPQGRREGLREALAVWVLRATSGSVVKSTRNRQRSNSTQEMPLRRSCKVFNSEIHDSIPPPKDRAFFFGSNLSSLNLNALGSSILVFAESFLRSNLSSLPCFGTYAAVWTGSSFHRVLRFG